MDLQLKGKKALVSGSTAGIGLSIAESLAKEGVSVVIAGRTKEKVDAAVARVGKVAPESEITGVVADLGTAGGVNEIVKIVPAVDILVNNLGIYEAKSFFDIDDNDWNRLFEINLMSGVRLSRHYMPGMLERNWGRVLFISSESGLMTPPEMIHYGLTKSAQLALMRGLAELTKGTNVAVNAILPGPTMSDGIIEFLQSMATSPNASAEEAEKEFFEKHRASSLLQRMIDPGEIANLVTFVASPLSGATNGTSLRADGGTFRAIY